MSTCGPRSPMIHTLIPFLHCFKANGGQLQWGAVPSTSPSQWRCWAVFVDVFLWTFLVDAHQDGKVLRGVFASGLPGCSLGLCHPRALPARGASTAHQWRQRGVATALRREWRQQCGSESVKSGLTETPNLLIWLVLTRGDVTSFDVPNEDTILVVGEAGLHAA